MKLILEEFRDNPFKRLNMAFALMSVIPFLVFIYIIAVWLYAPEVLLGYVGILLVVSLFISVCGLFIARAIIKNVLNKILFYAARLKKISSMKSAFVSKISHELREPLFILSSNMEMV